MHWRQRFLPINVLYTLTWVQGLWVHWIRAAIQAFPNNPKICEQSPQLTARRRWGEERERSLPGWASMDVDWMRPEQKNATAKVAEARYKKADPGRQGFRAILKNMGW